MKNVLLKDTVKEIKNTFKRFLSILLVVLLGVGFFAGIKATSPDMKKTVDKYYDDKNVMDIQIISTMGLTNNDIEALKNVDSVDNVVGAYFQDAIITIDEEDAVIKLETISDNVNELNLIDGKLPENIDECVVERSFLNWTGHSIGDIVQINAEKIKDNEGNEKELLKEKNMKIVGVVESPMYLSRERGSTKLGSGKIDYFIFINNKAINTDIYTTAYIQVTGAKKLESTSEEYEDIVQNVKDKIEKISDERKQVRYNDIYNEANKKIEDAKNTLNKEKQKAEKELKDAENKINSAKKEVQEGKIKLELNRRNANVEFANAEEKIKSAKKELNEKTRMFNESKQDAYKQIEKNKNTLVSLKQTKSTYEETKKNLLQKQKELKKLEEQLNSTNNTDEIEEIKIKIEDVSKQIYQYNLIIKSIEDKLTSQNLSIDTLAATIQNIESEIKKAEKQLANTEKQLNTAKSDLKLKEKQLSTQKQSVYAELNNASSKLEKAEEEIKENEEKLEKAKKEADKKIREAEEKLEDAQIKLKDIEQPEWYILDRKQNVGYASYVQDTDRIAKIATVFPVVFFVVAALISLTSMSRMVEEERVQIGTLKALGYTKLQIASKYIIYAVLATIIGSTIGLIIGFNVLPAIIADMYGMMYTLPKVILEFNMKYAVIGISVAVLCTVGASIYSCIKELWQTPANLMRPKAPKPGKRVIFEKIPFIWSKLNFTQKVTARNIFRYKKRFLMTIIGIMGCTALILAGFGLRDSISSMIPAQYGEIFLYDVQISLKDNIKSKEIEKEVINIENMEEMEEILKVNMQSVEITNIQNNQNIQLIIPENVEKMSEFIVLKSRTQKGENYKLSENGVIVTEKLARLLGIKRGDTIKLKNLDDIEIETKVEYITENYLMHYIYMSPELYENLYGENIRFNTLLANTKEISKEEQNVLGSRILEDKDVISGITFISSTQNMFAEVMENMNLVVWILIISAGLLAFVVLYNLSNTNISERIRELATIKVLGFYDKEVYDYVSRETIILTIIGIILGAFAGFFLTMFIIKTCELDILMFDKRVKTLSYVYAILITIIFETIVNITTYFSLKKIDMIESLKSIE